MPVVPSTPPAPVGLISIGPVLINHGDPKFSSSGESTAHGVRSLTISGSCSWSASDTLEELVANEHARVTKYGHTGVLEWLQFEGPLLHSRTGDYLLKGFARDADHASSLTFDDVPFSLVAAGPLP